MDKDIDDVLAYLYKQGRKDLARAIRLNRPLTPILPRFVNVNTQWSLGNSITKGL